MSVESLTRTAIRTYMQIAYSQLTMYIFVVTITKKF